MADFLSAYSVQQWLESAPQGYLMNTEYGHPPGEKEPELVLERSAAARAGDPHHGAARGRRALRALGLVRAS